MNTTTLTTVRNAVISLSEDTFAPLVQTYNERSKDFKNFTDEDVKMVCVGDKNELALLMGWVMARKLIKMDMSEGLKDAISRYYLYGMVLASNAALMASSELCDMDEESEEYAHKLTENVMKKASELCALMGGFDIADYIDECKEYRHDVASIMAFLFVDGLTCAIHQHKTCEIADALARIIREDNIENHTNTEQK